MARKTMAIDGTIVGLDFGMTNSKLAYYQPNTGPQPYHLPGPATFAIPTAIETESATTSLYERSIGRMARRSKSFIANFKVLLPQSGLDARQRAKNPAFQATSAYLDRLLTQFRADMEGKPVARMVATVPETWLSGRDQAGVDTLRAILHDRAGIEPQFLSEPVAAAAYFAHVHSANQGPDFDGHILVYDHGGSTLDIALVRVKGPLIEVVSSLGNSGTEADGGFGGVAYDRFMLAQMVARYPATFAGKSEADRKAWVDEFGTSKEDFAARISSRSENPDGANVRRDAIFAVSNVPVTLGDLFDTFDAHYRPQIVVDLDRVLADGASCDEIAFDDPARFCVVTVGGFSQFLPVQHLLETYFAARCGNDRMLQSGIVGLDRLMAVAKGACLVAAGTIDVNGTCPFTFGVVSYLGREPHPHTLMTAGEPVAQYRQARYLDIAFQLACFERGQDARSIVLFIENAGRRTELPMTHEFGTVLPDYGPARSWRLGCQVTNSTVFLAIKSDTGHTRTVRMGRLLRMAEGRITESVEPAAATWSAPHLDGLR